MKIEDLRLKAKSICPFCLKEFRHLKGYHPPTCGDRKCQSSLNSQKKGG